VGRANISTLTRNAFRSSSFYTTTSTMVSSRASNSTRYVSSYSPLISGTRYYERNDDTRSYVTIQGQDVLYPFWAERRIQPHVEDLARRQLAMLLHNTDDDEDEQPDESGEPEEAKELSLPGSPEELAERPEMAGVWDELARVVDSYTDRIPPRLRTMLMNRLYKYLGKAVLLAAGSPIDLGVFELDERLLEYFEIELDEETKALIAEVCEQLPEELAETARRPATALAAGLLENLVGRVTVKAGTKLAKIVCSFLDHYAGIKSLEDGGELPPIGQ
jgi:hypothetical protein